MNTDDRAPTKRTPEQLLAFDSGYGSRCIRHHRENPYPQGNDLRPHWDAGFNQAERDA